MRKYLALLLPLVLVACASVRPSMRIEDAPQDADVQVALAALDSSPDCNIPLELTVRFEPIEEGHRVGETSELPDGGGLLIRIDSRLTREETVDVIEHEWAHAMTWRVPRPDCHDEIWGAAFSRCYRAVTAALFPTEPLLGERPEGSR